MALLSVSQTRPAVSSQQYAPGKFKKLAAGCMRRLRRAYRVLVTGNDGSHVSSVNHSSAESEMPQAVVSDPSLQAHEKREWRRHFARSLEGKGLEIGPLHRPLEKHEKMDVDYIDRYTSDQLRAHYPELKDLPIVSPNIIGDAETMSGVPDGKYDFVVSAHVIEHMKNPIGAIRQWCRVLKPGGMLYLIVPDKRATFDRHRVRTTLEHMILDYERPSAERDFEHCLEYGLYVHGKTAQDAIKKGDNIVNTNYSIHYHVFIPADVVKLLQWFSANIRPLKILEGPCMTPGDMEFHILAQLA